MPLLYAAALLLAAPAETKPEGPVALTGNIVRTGTVYSPALMLVTDDGHRYDVVGDLWNELARLEGGAKLELKCLREKGGSLLPRVRAVSYRIVELPGGAKPEVGIVRVDGDQVLLKLDGAEQLKLSDTAVAQRLKSHVGEKVWVVGKPISSGLFKVWRVGFLGVPKAPASAPVEASSQPH
ncbi:MAG: hypothetical protein IT381_24350 [Deltaproteobacteria bacterium]|nr:hypothetical protein [Deltaproteobacteria bacterium]